MAEDGAGVPPTRSLGSPPARSPLLHGGVAQSLPSKGAACWPDRYEHLPFSAEGDLRLAPI